MTTTALQTLYQELAPCTSLDLNTLLPGGIQREVGHFNVFDIADLWEPTQMRPATPYACRSFYKISLFAAVAAPSMPSKLLRLSQMRWYFRRPK
ncbi:MAG: hypothetical protein ACRYFX_09485 [Janthinobacterium lividum]